MNDRIIFHESREKEKQAVLFLILLFSAFTLMGIIGLIKLPNQLYDYYDYIGGYQQFIPNFIIIITITSLLTTILIIYRIKSHALNDSLTITTQKFKYSKIIKKFSTNSFDTQQFLWYRLANLSKRGFTSIELAFNIHTSDENTTTLICFTRKPMELTQALDIILAVNAQRKQ